MAGHVSGDVTGWQRGGGGGVERGRGGGGGGWNTKFIVPR